MSSLDLPGGITCLVLGIYISIVQIKKFAKRKQDELGFDIKLLGGGIIFIIGGIALLASAF